MRPFRHMLTCVLALVGLFTILGPTHLKGALQTESGSQDRRPLSWRTQFQYLNPDRVLFTHLLSKLPVVKVKDPVFKVFERDHPSRWSRLNEALDNSETAIDVDDGTMFRADDMVLVPITGEIVKVSSISGNTLTVVRAQMGTTATAAADDAWVKILFSREMENGRAAEIITTDVSTQTNFTQIFKRTWGESDTSRVTARRGPTNEAEESKLAMQLLREDMEQAYLWGRKREEKSADGYIYRFTGGIDQFISTNRLNMNGGLGFGDIGYIMNVATRFGGTSKIWLCGRDARQQIDSLGLDYVQIPAKANKLGMAVTGFHTSFGDAMLLTHHGLDNAHADRIIVVDPAHAKIAQLRALKRRRNIQEPDRDGKKHEILTEGGLYLDTELAHVMVTNVTTSEI